MHPLDPTSAVRGRYEGYPGEAETLVALRCEVDNWRWAGVPFFLRTGKRMAEGWRISIAFREPPQSMFPDGAGLGEVRAGPPDVRPGRVSPPLALLLREATRAGHARQSLRVLPPGDGPHGRP